MTYIRDLPGKVEETGTNLATLSLENSKCQHKRSVAQEPCIRPPHLQGLVLQQDVFQSTIRHGLIERMCHYLRGKMFREKFGRATKQYPQTLNSVVSNCVQSCLALTRHKSPSAWPLVCKSTTAHIANVCGIEARVGTFCLRRYVYRQVLNVCVLSRGEISGQKKGFLKWADGHWPRRSLHLQDAYLDPLAKQANVIVLFARQLAGIEENPWHSHDNG